MKKNPSKLVSVTIEVTDARIKRGTVNDSENCPVVLGVRAVCKKGVEIIAEYEQVSLEILSGPGDTIHDTFEFATPARAAKFMETYDDRDSLDEEDRPALPKAFSFKVKIPNRFLKPSLQV